jgi:hypothetical protein
MNTYINIFYNPKNPLSKKVFCTEVKPIKYNNHLIYHRINSTLPIDSGAHVFDVVLNDTCIGQYAGLNGAKQFINNR